MGSILLHCDTKALFLTESLDDLFVSSETQSSQEYCKRELTCTVYTHADDAVLIFLKLKPSTSVGDDLRCILSLSSLTELCSEVSSGGTNDLGDDNSLGTVDDEGTVFRHDRKVTYICFLFLALTCLGVMESQFDLERSSIVAVFLSALFETADRIRRIEFFVKEIDFPNVLRVRYRRDLLENLLNTLIKKPVVGILLDLDKIGYFDYLVNTRVGHTHGLALFDGMHHYQITSCTCFGTLEIKHSERLITSDGLMTYHKRPLSSSQKGIVTLA